MGELITQPRQHSFPQVGVAHHLDGGLHLFGIGQQSTHRLQRLVFWLRKGCDHRRHRGDPRFCRIVPVRLFFLTGSYDQRFRQVTAVIQCRR